MNRKKIHYLELLIFLKMNMKMNEFECEMNPTLSHVMSFPRLLFNIHDREGKVT